MFGGNRLGAGVDDLSVTFVKSVRVLKTNSRRTRSMFGNTSSDLI